MFYILFSVVCCLSAYFIWLKRPKSSKCEPPSLAGRWPVIGHAKMLCGDTKSLWTLIKKLSKKCRDADGVIKVDVGPIKSYFLTDPEDCTTALNACNHKHYAYSFAKAWLGSGLLIAPVETWKVHRKLLNPIINQQVLNKFLGVFNRQSRKLMATFDMEVGKGPFNHDRHLLVSSLETICQTALGVDVGDKSAGNKEYLNAIDELLSIFVQRFTKLWLHSKYAFNMSNLKKQQDELIKLIHNMSNSVLQARKAKLAAENNTVNSDADKPSISEEFSPFMDLILKLSTEKLPLSDSDVLDEVNTLIITGYDTVGVTLCYTLMLLGSYPEVQERVYKEILEVFGDSDRDVEKQDLSKLVYMEAVIKEGLRVLPTIPIVARYTTVDIQLKKYVIPAGSTFAVLIPGIHSDPAWGDEVDQFKPERWLNPTTHPENVNIFGVFGIGRRSCIGKNYAMMSMKTTLAHLLRRFKISSDISKLVLKMEILLKPSSGQHISLERRV